MIFPVVIGLLVVLVFGRFGEGLTFKKGHQIEGLNDWLRPFSVKCHIHIINYHGSSFEEFDFPISVQNLYYGPTLHQTFDTDGTTVLKEEYSYGHERKEIYYGPLLPCLNYVFLVEQFDKDYLDHPPSYFGQAPNKGPPQLEFPPNLQFFWRHWRRHHIGADVDERIDPQGVIFTLISPQDLRIINGWLIEMSKSTGSWTKRFPNKRLVTFTLETQSGPEGISLQIIQSSLICHYCVSSSYTFVPFQTLNQTLESVEEKWTYLSQQQNVPWTVDIKYWYERGFRIYSGGRYTLGSVNENIFFGAIVNSSMQFRNFYYKGSVDSSKPTPMPPNVNLYAIRSLLFVTAKYEYIFLTCDGKDERDESKWTIFVKPFDVWTWVWIFITCAVLAFTIDIIMKKKREAGNGGSIIMLFSTILDHSIDSALNLNIWVVLTPWLLMTLVLTNAYKSLVTSHLIAPRQHVLLQDFDQLASRGYTIYARVAKFQSILYKSYSKSYWNRTPVWERSDLYFNYIKPVLGNIQHAVVLPPCIDRVKGIFILPANVNDWDKSSYGHLIMGCNKTAIADWSHVIDKEYHYVLTSLDEKQRANVAKGTVSLWNMSVGWQFVDVNDPRIRPRLRRITEAGIVDFWRGLDDYVSIHHIYRNNKNNNKTTDVITVKVLTMEDKVQFVFLLLVICLIIPVLGLVTEVSIKSLVPWVMMLWKNVVEFLKESKERISEYVSNRLFRKSRLETKKGISKKFPTFLW